MKVKYEAETLQYKAEILPEGMETD